MKKINHDLFKLKELFYEYAKRPSFIYFDRVNDITFPRENKRLLNYLLIGDKMQEWNNVSCNDPKRELLHNNLYITMSTRKSIVIFQTFTDW